MERRLRNRGECSAREPAASGTPGEERVLPFHAPVAQNERRSCVAGGAHQEPCRFHPGPPTLEVPAHALYPHRRAIIDIDDHGIRADEGAIGQEQRDRRQRQVPNPQRVAYEADGSGECELARSFARAPADPRTERSVRIEDRDTAEVAVKRPGRPVPVDNERRLPLEGLLLGRLQPAETYDFLHVPHGSFVERMGGCRAVAAGGMAGGQDRRKHDEHHSGVSHRGPPRCSRHAG